jgi:hypothetical protein
MPQKDGRPALDHGSAVKLGIAVPGHLPGHLKPNTHSADESGDERLNTDRAGPLSNAIVASRTNRPGGRDVSFTCTQLTREGEMKVCRSCSTWFSEVAGACPACAAGAAVATTEPNVDRAARFFLAAVAAIGLAVVAFMVWS